MAKKTPFQKKKIQDTTDSGFGNYQEGVGGGGSPEAKDPHQRAPGVNSDYRKENNDTMQPRTDDGKFTYKSVNGQSIDPKYGPSRGKTVNPLLTGGQNGIEIDEVERQFASKSGAYWDKYKDSWYQKGGEVVTSGDFKVRVAADTIWNVAKRIYNEVTGEFGGDIKFEHKLGNGGTKQGEGFGGKEEGTTFAETKKGRTGKEEGAAKQKAQASGEEQGVINQETGAIKVKPGTPAPVVPPKPQPAPQPAPRTGGTPIAPNGGLGQPSSGQVLQAPGQGNANNGGQGLSQSNMNVLNTLFGGSVPQGVVPGANNPTVKPSLQGFLKKKNKK